MKTPLNHVILKSLQRIHIWRSFWINEECWGLPLEPPEDVLWGWRSGRNYASHCGLRKQSPWIRVPLTAPMVFHPENTQARKKWFYLNLGSDKTHFGNVLTFKISALIWNPVTHIVWFMRSSYRANFTIIQITAAILTSKKWMKVFY